MSRLDEQAAARAASRLRALLLQHGAKAEDVKVHMTDRGAQLRGVRSAGVLAEFGSRARSGLRRMGQAIEALRQGGTR